MPGIPRSSYATLKRRLIDGSTACVECNFVRRSSQPQRPLSRSASYGHGFELGLWDAAEASRFENRRRGSSRRKIAHEHCCCGIGGISPRSLHLLRGFEHQLAHDA
jgi:hypothetical protein